MTYFLSAPIFEFSKIQKCCFFSKLAQFQQTQFWEVALSVLNSTSFKKSYFEQYVEIGFYWLVYFHCEYFRAHQFEDVVFLSKYVIWAHTVLKNAFLGFRFQLVLQSSMVCNIEKRSHWLVCFQCEFLSAQLKLIHLFIQFLKVRVVRMIFYLVI